jgi:hypothetical protein
VLSQFLPEGTEKYYEEPQDNRFPFNAFILRPAEYKPGVLPNLL